MDALYATLPLDAVKALWTRKFVKGSPNEYVIVQNLVGRADFAQIYPHIQSKLSAEGENVVMHSAKLSPEMLEKGVKSKRKTITRTLASREGLPQDVLRKLALNPDETTRQVARANSSADLATLQIWENDDFQADNPSTESWCRANEDWRKFWSEALWQSDRYFLSVLTYMTITKDNEDAVDAALAGLGLRELEELWRTHAYTHDPRMREKALKAYVGHATLSSKEAQWAGLVRANPTMLDNIRAGKTFVPHVWMAEDSEVYAQFSSNVNLRAAVAAGSKSKEVRATFMHATAEEKQGLLHNVYLEEDEIEFLLNQEGNAKLSWRLLGALNITHEQRLRVVAESPTNIFNLLSRVGRREEYKAWMHKDILAAGVEALCLQEDVKAITIDNVLQCIRSTEDGDSVYPILAQALTPAHSATAQKELMPYITPDSFSAREGETLAGILDGWSSTYVEAFETAKLLA